MFCRFSIDEDRSSDLRKRVLGLKLCIFGSRGYFLGAGLCVAITMLARSYPALLAHIEDGGVMLQPIEVPSQLLGDVGFASSRQANHDDNELGADIALRNLAIG